MYQSSQTLNRTKFGRKASYRLSLVPYAIAGAVAVATFLTPAGALATLISDFPSWEVASEFNDSINASAANPSLPWSYGWKSTLTGTFNLGVPYNPSADFSGWSAATGYPLVFHNVHAVTLPGSGLQATVPPHALGLHPGPSGEYAVLRFTAPACGVYRVSGQFYALDANGDGTTTDVWILPNNSTTGAFSGNVNYYAMLKVSSFTSIVFHLTKGSTLDFEVGFGSDNNYYFDSTGLNAVIEKIR
jgi:hypothetical protein